MKPHPLALAAAVAVWCSAAASALAATPAVQGPEAVQDWFNAGKSFIATSKHIEPIKTRAKNVILFVGDGMGISSVTGARILEGQLNGKPGEENRLSFETLPYVAFSKTYSWDQQTSDSAPTMSAIMTGYKTREGMLSVNHLTARGDCSAANLASTSVKTLLEKAADNGKATGVVSTARLTHATPAATYAHTPVRDWEADSNQPAGCEVKDIARQLLEVSPKVRNSLKVAMGGGRTYFLPKVKNGANFYDPEYPTQQGRRNDGRDLTQEWVTTRGTGAQFVWNKAQFDAIDPATTPYLLGLFEPSHMQYEADRTLDTAGEPSLTEMTDKAIKMLSRQPNGYFLHVEAGRVDHAHHAGNAKRALLDAIELSRAVKRAMEMTNEQDTLIIVTADHSHTFTIGGYPHRGNSITGLVREVPAIDGDPVKNAVDSNGLPYTTLAYANGPGYRVGGRPDLTGVDTNAISFLQEATVPLASETHAGEDVPIYARGPRAYLVHGSMEQNWIYHVMRHAFDF
ncbi:alkaline phosphatase [Ideonella sp. DXS29W]|uniref:Alkaline phosphatase n=1 Tax=Ideonella lacteola TaxID=2984193 RepID=A0ABU9BX81_9BURK